MFTINSQQFFKKNFENQSFIDNEIRYLRRKVAEQNSQLVEKCNLESFVEENETVEMLKTKLLNNPNETLVKLKPDVF